ncbi:GTPase [Acinetobacter sp. ME22]|uniref:GTPase n=1 Tax=Acinetobacter sp. ME22 TaxID=2904802 RepID=UPI001EDAAEBD|nr:GTPase [Acinetobacter sp. ME22]MCG2574481.1 GTPase [Acinetobacter sp. ME22]
MTTINQSDFFTAPIEQYRSELSFCTASVKGMQEWLLRLPSIHLGDSSKSLLNAVIEILELKCEEQLRFDLIQSLHLSLEQVLGTLEKYFLSDVASIMNHNESIVELAQQFRCYIARIYIHIAFEAHTQLNSKQFSLFAFRQKKQLQEIRSLSTYYALQQLSLLKFQQLVLYKSSLVGQWRIGHQLFILAEYNDFHLEDINHLHGSINQLTNIYQLYTQINLLDILNTHQIRPIEIQALFQCSYQWVQLIQIINKESANSRYIIDPNKDFPPVLNNTQLKKGEDCYFIETQALLEHINLANLPQNKQISPTEKHYLSSSLIFHVQNLLNNIPERRYERYDYVSNIQLAFGLQSAHYYLSHATHFEDTLLLESKVHLQQNNSKFMTSWSNDSTPTNSKSLYPTLDQDTKQIHSCTIMDISINGYRIRWTGHVPKQLRTGEFILVQENAQSPWRGGVIRWIKQASNKHLEFGVEILSQDLTPCAVQLSADRNTVFFHPAILLCNEVLNKNHLTIVVPGHQTFKPQQGVNLRLANKQIKIYLNDAKLISQSFSQFNFELLNDDEQGILEQHVRQHAETIKKQDVWESLK